jgi:hypothetical protein
MANFLSGESFRQDVSGATARGRRSIPIAGNRTARAANARVGSQWGDHKRNVDHPIIGENA